MKAVNVHEKILSWNGGSSSLAAEPSQHGLQGLVIEVGELGCDFVGDCVGICVMGNVRLV